MCKRVEYDNFKHDPGMYIQEKTYEHHKINKSSLSNI